MHGTQPYLFYQTKIQIIKNKKIKIKTKGKGRDLEKKGTDKIPP